MDIKTQLLKKINDKKATIGIFGLGYVGLPLAIRFVQVGFKVIGFDINTEKVDQLNKSSSFIDHIPDRLIQKINDKGFKATSDFAEVQNADALIICVPLPFNFPLPLIETCPGLPLPPFKRPLAGNLILSKEAKRSISSSIADLISIT